MPIILFILNTCTTIIDRLKKDLVKVTNLKTQYICDSSMITCCE